MGGHNGNHADPMDWTEEGEKYFLEILMERVKRDSNGAPTLKGIDWMEIDELIYMKFALRYGPYRLKAKFHRLRLVHAKFSELTNTASVTWDSSSGKVFASGTVWDNYLKRHKVFKTFKKKGCKLYPLLSIFFNSSSTSGVCHNASTSAPQTSEGEQRIAQEYPGEGEVGEDEVDEDEVDEDEADEDEESDCGRRKRITEGDLACHSGKRRVKKNVGRDKYNALMDAWLRSIAERYKSDLGEATSSVTEAYSIRDCMVALEDTPDVSTTSYNKAIQFFVDPNWRKIFLLMPKDRRKCWLDDLD